MRIALIHALKHSILPIETSFAQLWPDARLMNLMDDSLSADLAQDGRLTDGMTERFQALGRYVWVGQLFWREHVVAEGQVVAEGH